MYGKSLEKFTLLEVSLIVNNKIFWNESNKYDEEFKNGLTFSIPLTNFISYRI